jgi:Na+(H+)/acetate symporter ActP
VTPALAVAAVAAVAALTLGVASLASGRARRTSDFYVAGRTVRPWVNASAIGGEYLSAASFLGVAGLVLVDGVDALWFPVGYTVGYLVLLTLVAAPLRRSGAYTLADFAELRLGGAGVRRGAAVVVAIVGLLYLLPQFVGAAVTWRAVTGLPGWIGVAVVAVVVGASVYGGGMRSITLVQAMHYWLKLTAIAVPAAVMVVVWRGDGSPVPAAVDPAWALPGTGPDELYATYSLLLALFLGTMGLPHVLVRFYTNPDGAAARRTASAVIGLLGLFYVWPPVYAVLALVYAPALATGGRADAVVVELPGLVVPGVAGAVLSAVALGGAFAAFASTASGLTVSVAGVLSRDLRVRPRAGPTAPAWGFRAAAAATLALPAALAVAGVRVPLAETVGLAFALAASTFAPLLLLGLWWPGLRRASALAGVAVGGTAAAVAAVVTLGGSADASPPAVAAALAQPAAWTVPLAVLVMVGGSLAEARRGRPPARAAVPVPVLHRPEPEPPR